MRNQIGFPEGPEVPIGPTNAPSRSRDALVAMIRERCQAGRMKSTTEKPKPEDATPPRKTAADQTLPRSHKPGDAEIGDEGIFPEEMPSIREGGETKGHRESDR